MNALIVKLMSQVSTLSEELQTNPEDLIGLMKNRIDVGRALDAVLTGTPLAVRDEADDDRITASDIKWCMDKLKFLLQPENQNEFVRILDQREDGYPVDDGGSPGRCA